MKSSQTLPSSKLTFLSIHSKNSKSNEIVENKTKATENLDDHKKVCQCSGSAIFST